MLSLFCVVATATPALRAQDIEALQPHRASAVDLSAVPWSSQVGQDRLVATLLGPDHKGYFVDLASNDPVHISNSRALEHLGYQGLCIEPNPHYHPLYAKAKRSCNLVPFAISAQPGTVPFAFHPNKPEAKKGEQFDDEAFGGIALAGLDNALAKDTVQVQAVTFGEVLRNFSVPSTISYMSLDVEGAESLVMETFPWHTHVLSLLTVERPHDDLRAKLAQHGYKHVCNSGYFGDQLWAHSSTRFDMLSLARWPPMRCPGKDTHKGKAQDTLQCHSLIDANFECATA